MAAGLNLREFGVLSKSVLVRPWYVDPVGAPSACGEYVTGSSDEDALSQFGEEGAYDTTLFSRGTSRVRDGFNLLEGLFSKSQLWS